MRTNMEFSKVSNPLIVKGLQLSSCSLVPADNFPLPADGPPLWFMNPGGAIDVLLPTSNAARKGLTFFVWNESANAITFKTDGDAAFTTAIVIAGGEGVMLVCTGSSTQAVGWRGSATAAST